MNVLLISPNGLQELSGGGLYLRSLAQALCASPTVSRLTVMSKSMGSAEKFEFPASCKRIYLKKNKLRDVVARLGLCPTYLMTYRSRLAREARDADVILFHNSRLGRLMSGIRKDVPGKTFGILSDNVEAVLKGQHRGENLLQRVCDALDTQLIRHAEAPSRSADFMTFITEADRSLFASEYGIPARTGILPISLSRGVPDMIGGADTDRPAQVLFTAHFGFAPNQTALRHFAEVAKTFTDSGSTVQFVVAGARAAEMAEPYRWLHVIDSPEPGRMSAAFASASVYLAPVSWGSGMKTKVAEALSFGLPVICMPNAAVGYEAMLSDDRYRQAICVVDDVAEMTQNLHRILQTGDRASLRNAAFAAFDALYSQASQTRRLELLLLAQ
ncbi:glycosyltransferase [Cupriavidus oxalaticus]|uniref:glycosyltransferase n=1 Tax=Cupriavidus oxalaticus TaxID=96344 RepID=UPI0031745FBA